MRRRGDGATRRLTLAVLASCWPLASWPQPQGPVRILVGTPPGGTGRLSDAARAATQSEGFRRRLEADAAEPVGNAPEEFARFVREDVPRWAELVRYSGAKPE